MTVEKSEKVSFKGEFYEASLHFAESIKHKDKNLIWFSITYGDNPSVPVDARNPSHVHVNWLPDYINVLTALKAHINIFYEQDPDWPASYKKKTISLPRLKGNL